MRIRFARFLSLFLFKESKTTTYGIMSIQIVSNYYIFNFNFYYYDLIVRVYSEINLNQKNKNNRL